MNRRYWVMRTDRTQAEYISAELRDGRMRQGWGYREDLNLAELSGLVRSGETLSSEQRDAWGNRRLLPSEPNSIREGDIVLLPNLPEDGRWLVAEVADDEYRYEIPPEFGDYGHVRNVQLLNPDSPINPYDEAVSARLRGTMKVPRRLWNIDHHSADVRTLLEALEEGRPVDRAQGGEERLESAKDALKARLWEQLVRRFRGEEFEGPCGRLLDLLYEEVEYTAGSGENGADFICSYSDGLGVPHNVAVQVKMWTDELGNDLTAALEQLKRAYLYYPEITSAVVVTTLEDIGERSTLGSESLSKELGIPIRIVSRDDLLDLFLRHLPEMTEALDDPSTSQEGPAPLS